MTDNVGQNGYDETGAIIAGRLGEHKRKLDRMAAWEKGAARGKARARMLYAGVSIAACIALAVIVGPLAGPQLDRQALEAPGMSLFRAATPGADKVEQLIASQDYYKALDIVEPMLEESDRKVKETAKEGRFDDEEWTYSLKAEKLMNAELRWTYIYLLVMVECDRSAVKELKKYLKDEESCLHKDEADNMLRALR